MDHEQDRISKIKQDSKNRTDFKNRIGHYRLLLLKIFYLKLPNAYITMLRNTAASKTAIGPLNTFKNKIITVLTP
jgi:hypothetical protein